MFTGIVEELGRVRWLDVDDGHARLEVHGPLVVQDATHGASIAVNGICLTVVRHDEENFTVDVMAETLQRTNLAELSPGDPVNLERALPAAGRLGGHIVQGHVDAVATILERTPGPAWETVRFSLPPHLSRHVVEKGSIAVDGVSLTVAALDADSFTVGLIPTTLQATTLGRKTAGETVNLEVDVLAKYVARLVQR